MAYDATEKEYVRAERAGMLLDSILCPECPDPGLCGAEGACVRDGERDPGLWDDPERVELVA